MLNLAGENTIDENVLSNSIQEGGVRLLNALFAIASRETHMSKFVFLQIIKREMTYKIQIDLIWIFCV